MGKTAFEKTKERISELIESGIKREKEEQKITDTDGMIIAFENGIAIFNDGQWYEREYAPMTKIFKNPDNIIHYLDYVKLNFEKEEANKACSAFLSWIYNSDMEGKCPVKYSDIVQTEITALNETRIEEYHLTNEETRNLMSFSPRQLEVIEEFERAGKALQENNIKLLFCNNDYCLRYFNTENTVDNRIGCIDDLETYIPEKELDENRMKNVNDFGKDVRFNYGDYFEDDINVIFKENSEL